jgi:hypothetical protein
MLEAVLSKLKGYAENLIIASYKGMQGRESIGQPNKTSNHGGS